jgi:hypothetical protein
MQYFARFFRLSTIVVSSRNVAGGTSASHSAVGLRVSIVATRNFFFAIRVPCRQTFEIPA